MHEKTSLTTMTKSVNCADNNIIVNNKFKRLRKLARLFSTNYTLIYNIVVDSFQAVIAPL